MRSRDLVGATTDYTVNAAGQVLSTKDANGNTASFQYDGDGNLTDISDADPLFSPNAYFYASDNPTDLLDPTGQDDVVEEALVQETDAPEYVNLASASRTQHILYGDTTGGGYLYPGLPGKTPFHPDWDPGQIMHAISDIATDPDLPWAQVTGPEGSPGNPRWYHQSNISSKESGTASRSM